MAHPQLNTAPTIQHNQLPDNIIFQKDMDRSNRVEGHLENSVCCLNWPSRSPDLNQIEHVSDANARKINSKL